MIEAVAVAKRCCGKDGEGERGEVRGVAFLMRP